LNYTRTLFSGAMLTVLVAHTLEDIVLISIGRFLPVPVPALYAIGLCLSWLVMGRIIQWVQKSR
jgi:hypothetical protein